MNPSVVVRWRPRSLTLIAAAAVAVAVVGCSSASITVRPAPTVPPEPKAAVAPVLWPLTAEPASNEADTRQSAVVAKVDNERQARPHAALMAADMVYEVWVEGITRFAAVYHSEVPERVGPVRSGRSTDVDLVANLGRPILVWSGGNANVNAELGNAAALGVLINGGVDAQPELYQRDSSRRAPHNLYADARALRELLGNNPDNVDPLAFPFPLFSFRTEETTAEPVGDPAAGISIEFGAGVTVQYVWDEAAGCARRFEDNAVFTDEDGTGVCPRNVVVQFTPYGPSTADARSPQAYTVGSGTGLVYSQGRLALVAWNRPTPADGPNLVYVDGQPALLEPGRTWVAVAPEGTSTVPLSPEQAATLAAD